MILCIVVIVKSILLVLAIIVGNSLFVMILKMPVKGINFMKKAKKYTENVSAKVHPHTADIIRNSKYSVREAIEYFANQIKDPVENLKIRKKILTEEIERIMIREINPLKEELGDVEYKLKQFNIDTTIDDNVLSIARKIKNLYNRQSIYSDLLSFIKSDDNLVAEVNRCHMPFEEFMSVIERLMNDE